MTGKEHDSAQPSIMETIEDDSREANEIAAARAMNHSLVILHKALAQSGMKQADLARILNVGESRVSQVLNGEGNIKITSFARFLRSMGYEPEFMAKPIDSSQPLITAKNERAKRRKSRQADSQFESVDGQSFGRDIARQSMFINQFETWLKLGTSSLNVRPKTSYRNGFEENLEHIPYGVRNGSWNTTTR